MRYFRLLFICFSVLIVSQGCEQSSGKSKTYGWAPSDDAGFAAWEPSRVDSGVALKSKVMKRIIEYPRISFANSLNSVVGDGKKFLWKVSITNNSKVKAIVTLAVDVFETDQNGKLLVRNGVPVKISKDETVSVEAWKTREVSGEAVFDSVPESIAMNSRTTHIDGCSVSEIK